MRACACVCIRACRTRLGKWARISAAIAAASVIADESLNMQRHFRARDLFRGSFQIYEMLPFSDERERTLQNRLHARVQN